MRGKFNKEDNMPVYVEMKDITDGEVVLLKVRGAYDLEWLDSNGINLNQVLQQGLC